MFGPFCQGTWRCEVCGTWTNADKPSAKNLTETCKGHIAIQGASRWTDMGHKIALVEGDAPFAFCSRCGAWGNRRARNLRLPCKGPSPVGSMALARTGKGKHPWRGKLAGGGEAPRSNIIVTKVFSKAANSWAGSVNQGPGRSRNRSKGIAVTTAPAAEAAVTAAGGDVRDHRVEGAPRQMELEDVMDIGEEYPPEVASDCEQMSDEDPFGHGGALTQEGGSIGRVVHSDIVHGDRGEERSIVVGEGMAALGSPHSGNDAMDARAAEGQSVRGAKDGRSKAVRGRMEALLRRVRARGEGKPSPGDNVDADMEEGVVPWQLTGGGEPPAVAGLPLPQTHGIGALPFSREQERGGGCPQSARGQMHHPGDPAERRGLPGSEPPRCRRGGVADGCIGIDIVPGGGGPCLASDGSPSPKDEALGTPTTGTYVACMPEHPEAAVSATSGATSSRLRGAIAHGVGTLPPAPMGTDDADLTRSRAEAKDAHHPDQFRHLRYRGHGGTSPTRCGTGWW